MLAAAVAGCGGQPTDHSDMNVVVPEPGVNVSSKRRRNPGSAGWSPPAAALAAAAAPAAAPGAPAVARGWGTFKGQVVFDGTPPPPKVLQDKGKAAKDPRFVRSTGRSSPSSSSSTPPPRASRTCSSTSRGPLPSTKTPRRQ